MENDMSPHTVRSAFTNPRVAAAVKLTDELATQLGVPAERVQVMRDTDRSELRLAFLKAAQDLTGNTLNSILEPSGAGAAERLAIAALVIREQELA